MNKIQWQRKAIKELQDIPKQYQVKIVNAITLLEQYPNCLGDIKQLTNRNEKRLRVGRYRIIFNHYQTVEIIQIEEVKKRDDRTY